MYIGNLPTNIIVHFTHNKSVRSQNKFLLMNIKEERELYWIRRGVMFCLS